jgi:CubicO group peptidase (beta-lactamase class C family)
MFRPISRAAFVILAFVPTGESSQAQVSRVDTIFAAFDKSGSPGCAVAVSDGGKTVFAKGYGQASLEHDLSLTATSAFYAASVSKQFTAFAVAMLAKQGKLSLDDDVRKWIPEVPGFGKTITVRHLIHHTSGLRDYFGLLGMTGWVSDGPLTEARFLDLVSRQRALNFEPGARYLYSNTGYVLLSILVKRVSGQSLREFADASMFAPLGMTNTHFRDDHTALVKNRALAYRPRAGGGWQLDMPGFDVVGDGGLFTTVEDLLKWAANADARTVGGYDVATLVLTRGRLNSGDSIPYAFGISHGMHRGLPTIDHSGAYGGYRAHLLRFPTQRLAVATMCNAASANSVALGQQVAAVFLGDRLTSATATQAGAFATERTVTVPRDRLERHVGAYWDATTETLTRVELRGDVLAIANTPIVLNAIADDRFRGSNGVSVFSTEPDGTPRLELTTATNQRFVSRRMPAPRTDAQTLAGYAGDFRSEELDVTWTILAKAGQLMLRIGTLPERALRPAFLDAFESPAGVMRFTRDGSGRVTGFIVGAGRVTGFRFDARRDR